MHGGFDIGYSHSKVEAGGKTLRLASISGNYERATYSIEATTPTAIVLEIPGDGTWVVGEGTAQASRFTARRQDRAWFTSPEWKRYFLATVTEISQATRLHLDLVTGLPVTWYAQDWETLAEHIRGEHRVRRLGRNWQTIRVRNVEVVPQPFGTLLSMALDEHGRIVDQDIANERIAIIDVGGNTTGYLAVDQLGEIPFETTSIDTGCWEALTLIRDQINHRYPGLELEDHDVVNLVSSNRHINYYDQTDQDVSDIVERAVQPLANKVIGQATTLWNSGARFRTILITGGGAHLVGDHIKREFPHARVVSDPVMANARGYYRFARRLFK